MVINNLYLCQGSSQVHLSVKEVLASPYDLFTLTLPFYLNQMLDHSNFSYCEQRNKTS